MDSKTKYILETITKKVVKATGDKKNEPKKVSQKDK